MTLFQKQIIKVLLNGGSVYNARQSGYRLRDMEANLVLKFASPTFNAIKDYVRKDRLQQVYRIDKNASGSCGKIPG